MLLNTPFLFYICSSAKTAFNKDVIRQKTATNTSMSCASVVNDELEITERKTNRQLNKKRLNIAESCQQNGRFTRKMRLYTKDNEGHQISTTFCFLFLYPTKHLQTSTQTAQSSLGFFSVLKRIL